MPRRCGEDEIEASADRCRLKCAIDDVDVRKGGKVAPSQCGKLGTDLDAGDPKSQTSERSGGLPGSRTDLQQSIARRDSCPLDQRLVHLLRVVRTRTLIPVSYGVEGGPQPRPFIRHLPIMLVDSTDEV